MTSHQIFEAGLERTPGHPRTAAAHFNSYKIKFYFKIVSILHPVLSSSTAILQLAGLTLTMPSESLVTRLKLFVLHSKNRTELSLGNSVAPVRYISIFNQLKFSNYEKSIKTENSAQVPRANFSSQLHVLILMLFLQMYMSVIESKLWVTGYKQLQLKV